MKKEYNYLQIPLMLIKEAYTDFEECKQKILSFAIVDYAIKLDVSKEDQARQALYNYFRGGGLPTIKRDMQPIMEELEDKHDDCFVDPEYCFFSNPNETARDEMVEAFIPYLEKIRDAKLNCQLNKIKDFFGVEYSDKKNQEKERYNRYIKICKEVEDHEAKHGKDPRPTILTDIFFDIEDPEIFTTYIAIRSIEGQRKWTATNRPTIAGRITGAKSKSVVEDCSKMTEIFEKFNNRYRMDKMITKLFKRGLIKSIMRIPKHSNFYLSTKLNAKELGEAVANQKVKRDIKKQNQIALKIYNEVTTSI